MAQTISRGRAFMKIGSHMAQSISRGQAFMKIGSQHFSYMPE